MSPVSQNRTRTTFPSASLAFLAIAIAVAMASLGNGVAHAEQGDGLQAGDNALVAQDLDASQPPIAEGVQGGCKWVIDSYGTLTLSPDEGAANAGTLTSFALPPWFDYAEQITSFRVEGTVTAESCMNMFFNCTKLTDVDLNGLDTSNVVAVAGMFESCTSLKSVDVSMLNTSHVRGFEDMFPGCTSLETLDLSNFDTANATGMSRMFRGCSSLKTVIVGDGWATENITTSSDMFTGCTSLVGANGTSFANAQVTDVSYAHIDTAESPGYFWPVGSGGNEGGDTPGDDPAPVVKPVSLAKATIILSAKSYAYNGKVRTPGVTVKLAGKTLKKGVDYTVSYAKGRKAIGTYKVTVVGKGSYSSKASTSFKIVPKKSAVKSLVAHKNSNGTSGFIVTWKKIAKSGIGYQVRWARSKAFKTRESATLAATSPFAKQGKAALRVRTKSWLGKTVYVQVRCFKKVSGKKYYSAWSTAKAVRLKK